MEGVFGRFIVYEVTSFIARSISKLLGSERQKDLRSSDVTLRLVGLATLGHETRLIASKFSCLGGGNLGSCCPPSFIQA